MAQILVIDDEDNLALSIQLALQRAEHHCRITSTAQEGLAAFKDCPPDLLLVDIQLPDGDGLQVLEEVRREWSELPVIVITAFGTIASAVEAMRRGAENYLPKPLSMEELILAVDRALDHARIRGELDAHRETQRRVASSTAVIGESPVFRDALALAERVADIPVDGDDAMVTVLLLGETGTGKEVVARHVHQRSAASDQPFVHVNCTAIPEALFESELFGHESGAFTHARAAKRGLFSLADGGTLMLDEIGDMPLSMQAKLLTALESGRFRRLGGTTEHRVRVRVIAATNSDLDVKVANGEFRADLFYRLNVFSIALPPLRERGDDLDLLADYFLGIYARKFRRPQLGFSAPGRAALRHYAWPGNVRELANVVQRAALVSTGNVLEPAQLGIVQGTVDAAPPAFDFDGDDCRLETVERALVESALARCGGNISQAARMLGISRGSLRNRVERFGLN